MKPSSSRTHAGYTAIEILVVLGMLAILAGMAWPKVSEWIERAELSSAAQVLVVEIRRVQREARASGRRIRVVVAPPAGAYSAVFPDGTVRAHRLAASLAFGFPDNPSADGVTFRDNTIWIGPRLGPQNSVGSIGIRSRSGAARKVTVSLTGHASITAWDGSRWN